MDNKELQQNLSSNDLLQELEAKLSTYIENPKNWVEIYREMKKAETRSCYLSSYPSQTAWVKDFCVRHGITKARLWNAITAGEFYEDWAKHHNKAPSLDALIAGRALPDPQNILIIRRIGALAPELVDPLMGRLLIGDVKRGELDQKMREIKRAQETGSIGKGAKADSAESGRGLAISNPSNAFPYAQKGEPGRADWRAGEFSRTLVMLREFSQALELRCTEVVAELLRSLGEKSSVSRTTAAYELGLLLPEELRPEVLAAKLQELFDEVDKEARD